jgi:histidinol-phosphatase (PHP family)
MSSKIELIKYNFHSHTKWCNHATGLPEDYIVRAIEHGMESYGISDHAPYDFIGDLHVRMRENQFDEYVSNVSQLKVKYKDKINIKLGLEIEYFKDKIEHIKRHKSNLDYLILGQHYIEINGNLVSSFGLNSKSEIMTYANQVESALKTGLFKILAHPDIFMNNYPKWDDTCNRVTNKILNACIENDVIVEYNGNGHRRDYRTTDDGYHPGYPRNEFWKIVEQYQDIKTNFGMDVHSPDQINDLILKKAYTMYKELKVKEITKF